MTAFNTFCIEFNQDADAPPSFRRKWLDMCDYYGSSFIGTTKKNTTLIRNWLSRCQNEHLRSLPLLDRYEWGVGGNNNVTDRQIRFQCNLYTVRQGIVDWRLERSEWSNDELLDLCRAFVLSANEYMQTADAGINACMTEKIVFDFELD